MQPHKEFAAGTSESPTTILEHTLPQMAATVFVPIADAAASRLPQTSAVHSVSQSAASPDSSTRTAPVFVPGLPVLPTIVHTIHEPDNLTVQIPPKAAPAGQRTALNAAPVSPSDKTATQQLKNLATAQLQHIPGERSPDHPLLNDELDAPAAPHSLEAPGNERFSISAQAIERLHTEQQKTAELNMHLDQLAARLADPRH